VGRDSSVDTATRYGLDGPGIESRWGRDSPHPSRLALRPTQPPIQWAPVLFPGGKAAGAWRWPPTLSCAEVKERVELYFYSPSGPSWPVLGWPLPLPLPFTTFSLQARIKNKLIKLNFMKVCEIWSIQWGVMRDVDLVAPDGVSLCSDPSVP